MLFSSQSVFRVKVKVKIKVKNVVFLFLYKEEISLLAPKHETSKRDQIF